MDEELLSRQQPQSLEAEQAVLGSILIDSRCITDVVGIVKPEDFYLQTGKYMKPSIPCSTSPRPLTRSRCWTS